MEVYVHEFEARKDKAVPFLIKGFYKHTHTHTLTPRENHPHGNDYDVEDKQPETESYTSDAPKTHSWPLFLRKLS